MAEKKIIAVVGATGAQGSGLVKAILNDPSGEFTVRALTRDVNSTKAMALAKMGVEVVAADVNDVSSLTRAFTGAYGAFCVTFFWEHFSGDTEYQQASNLAHAAKAAGVQHVIWSTLEDTRRWIPVSDTRMPTLQGKFKVPHFDAKGEANQIFTNLGVPTTLLNTSYYWENFIFFGTGPKPGPDGKYVLTMPMDDKKLPGIAAEDIGKCALTIFKNGKEYIGKELAISGDNLTGAQLAAAMSKALGKEIVYNSVSPDAFRGFGFPGADEMGNMYQFKRDCEKEYCGARDVNRARSLNPELQTFEQWLAKNASRIPLE